MNDKINIPYLFHIDLNAYTIYDVKGLVYLAYSEDFPNLVTAPCHITMQFDQQKQERDQIQKNDFRRGTFRTPVSKQTPLMRISSHSAQSSSPRLTPLRFGQES